MSKCMRYRVPTIDSNAYVISNCLYYRSYLHQYELSDRMIGDLRYPPIVLANSGGTALDDISDCEPSDAVPKSVWNNATKKRITQNWYLTSVRIDRSIIDFHFSYKENQKPGRKASIKAEKDIRFYLYVPRMPKDDSLLEEYYLIESVSDKDILSDSIDKYRFKVTEHYHGIDREVMVDDEPNPYYNPDIHPESLRINHFLLITEISTNDSH